jgi:hypothetical protein
MKKPEEEEEEEECFEKRNPTCGANCYLIEMIFFL